MSTPGLRGLLAVLSLEFEPAGVVMGAGVHQIFRPGGCRGIRPKTSAEPLIYPTYEGALRDAWRSVIERLREEAVNAGAHGVLGVSVSQSWAGPAAQMFELQLIGTAVRVPGQPATNRPFLSTLAMPDFLKLLLGGWVPCGITWGVAAVHVHSWASNPFVQRKGFSNAEMTAPTACVQLARSRLEREARANLAATGGSGAVNMTISLSRLPQSCGVGTSGQGVLVDGRIIGTAVVRYRSPVVKPSAVLDLAARGAP